MLLKKSKNIFKVGDIIRMKKPFIEYGVRIGTIGMVLEAEDESTMGSIGISFQNFTNGHELGGLLPEGSKNGLYVQPSMLELINKEKDFKGILCSLDIVIKKLKNYV
jgi:hypothetical protein